MAGEIKGRIISSLPRHPSHSDVSRLLLFTFGETEVEAAATLLADAYLREHHIELDRASMKKAG